MAFRRLDKKKQFDLCLEMFESRHKTFFTPSGARNRANAFAAAFWAGYDGLNTGLWSYSSADSKDTVGYIFYKAGQQCRQNEGE